jgi:hypothetical protein
MWGTREPPDWLARRWKRKQNDNKGKGKSEGGQGEEEDKAEGQEDAGGAGGDGEGQEKAEGSGEAEGDVEAGGGVQRRANNSSWAGPSIRLPPLPKLYLPEVSPAKPPSGHLRWFGLVCKG